MNHHKMNNLAKRHNPLLSINGNYEKCSVGCGMEVIEAYNRLVYIPYYTIQISTIAKK